MHAKISNINGNFGIVCIMKKFLFILFILFVCGVLSADICLNQMQGREVLIDLTVFKQYATAKMTFTDMFWSLLYERLKLFIGVVLLCFTPFKERLCLVLILMFSFIWGFFMMSCIRILGVAGLVVGFTSVVPHWGIYGMIIWKISSRNKNRSYDRRTYTVMNTGKYMFLILLFITACIIESLVAMHFIPWIIRLSMI